MFPSSQVHLHFYFDKEIPTKKSNIISRFQNSGLAVEAEQAKATKPLLSHNFFLVDLFLSLFTVFEKG